MSLILSGSPLAALRSRGLWGVRVELGFRAPKRRLLHRVTAEPVSNRALMVAPPTEMFTSGLLFPEYLSDVNIVKQVIMHWGRFLLNAFPRDRFPTPFGHNH